MKAATFSSIAATLSDTISIHAAREGGDLGRCTQAKAWYEFQSTPPVKAATLSVCIGFCQSLISIHAAREGGDQASFPLLTNNLISIHAAREGGDVVGLINGRLSSISIHAAREGGDVPDSISKRRKTKFQSTPPVKAATACCLLKMQDS